MEAAISLKVIYKQCCHVLSSILQIILFSGEVCEQNGPHTNKGRDPLFGLSNPNATHSSFPLQISNLL